VPLSSISPVAQQRFAEFAPACIEILLPRMQSRYARTRDQRHAVVRCCHRPAGVRGCTGLAVAACRGSPPARLVTVGCALRARRLTAEECVDVLTSVARLKPPLTEKSYAMLKRLCDAVEAIIDECLPPQLSHIAWALAVLQVRRLRARTSNAILPCAFSEAHGSIDAHLQPMPAAGCPRLYRHCVCSPLVACRGWRVGPQRILSKAHHSG
jgi:hypothetical protein